MLPLKFLISSQKKKKKEKEAWKNIKSSKETQI